MAYIEQIQTPIVVDTTSFKGKLETHPSILEHPELFRIVKQDLPKEYTKLNYNNGDDK